MSAPSPTFIALLLVVEPRGYSIVYNEGWKQTTSNGGEKIQAMFEYLTQRDCSIQNLHV